MESSENFRYYNSKKVITNTRCVETLSKIICNEFNYGDTIGITFIEAGVASIATGTFLGIEGGIVIVKELLLEDTTSFISLCDVNSIEKGITSAQGNSPFSVKLS